MRAGAQLLRGALVSGGRLIDDGVLAVQGDRITYAGPVAGWTGTPPPPALPRGAGYLLPGLVDVHCHGGAGHGFPDADRTGVVTALEHHRRHGTTTMLASLVSAPGDVLAARIELLAPLVAAGELAGIHLEGPFLSAARCGAQDPAAIVPGDPDLLRRLLELGAGGVRSMTLAPETARYRELVTVLAEHGALPSVGHTDADAAATTAGIAAALDAGGGTPASATHLFNAMPPMHHRAPGPVAACLAAASRAELVLELIADGVHLADETVAMVFDLVGPERIALVTDAGAAAGQPDGRYLLGSVLTEVTGGVARLVRPTRPGQPAPIAAGTNRLVDVVRRAVRLAGVDLAAAVTAASATPARLLGLTDVGELAPGRRADVLVTDDELNPVAVLRAGRWVRSETGREAV
jgi:N-acetylglucosamine-6-phosphate deacetylase